jgi:hypothetical protein
LKQLSLYSILLLIFVFSCKKGEKNENLLPETSLFVKEINLVGEARKTTSVKLHWSGQDKDGYIKYFEISVNNEAWKQVFVQDSTFLFIVPVGDDSTNVNFKVRAVDNNDAIDPTPAELTIPIKNTIPVAKLDLNSQPTDTTLTVFSLLWSVSDADGEQNLDSVYVKINDANWVNLPKNIFFLTFVPKTPTQSGAVVCDLYRDYTGTKISATISGLKLNENNRIYLKAKDISGAFSDIDSTSLFYVKKKNSNLLVVDAFESVDPNAVYFPILNNIAAGFDLLDLYRDNGKYIPSFWNPTFELYLGIYEKVFWFNDNNVYKGKLKATTPCPNPTPVTPQDGNMMIEAAAPAIRNYLNNNGKIFVTTRYQPCFKNTSPIFGFSSIDRIIERTVSEQARIGTDSIIKISSEFRSSFPDLKASATISGVFPFYPKPGTKVLASTNIIKLSGWEGPDNIIGIGENNLGNTNQIYVSVEMHRLNKDLPALEQFMNQVLNNEFNW